jgi:Na+-transporting methylmalonyl-CoA/oxaloacetate decarboxylase gamma subunit
MFLLILIAQTINMSSGAPSKAPAKATTTTTTPATTLHQQRLRMLLELQHHHLQMWL